MEKVYPKDSTRKFLFLVTAFGKYDPHTLHYV